MARLGTAYTPGRAKQPKDLAKLPPGNPWQYAHHPDCWAVFDGELMPVLNQVAIAPGVNHIGSDLDLSELYMRFEAKGWTFIPYDFGSEDGDSYLRRIDVIGGHAYLPRFVHAVPGTRKTITDSEAGHDFLREVKASLAPPMSYALEELSGTLGRTLADVSANADRNPKAAKQRDRIAADLEVVEAEIKAARARDAESIKPKRLTKAKAKKVIKDAGSKR